MPNPNQQQASTPSAVPNRDVRTALLKGRLANPALQRLQGRVLSQAEPSDVITSYDRMHHRHSRS
ncbi:MULTISPECIES: YhhA family cyclophane-containing RiPP [unclassified Mesorhizobium]|uniref:YhhA family cyclophane-containing RiPP n=1 Tax=unclassified Mesorhizobium TaxID=325217 RepID=UPI002699E24E